MISEKVDKFSVKLDYGDNIVNNQLLYHAEDTYPILKDIYNKKTPFFSDAYSLLANTLERMYKGVAAELQMIYPDENFHLQNIEESHYCHDPIRKINKYIPIASNKDAYYTVMDNFSRIMKGYTNSKYGDIYEYSDFRKDFDRYETQRKRLYQGLNNELTKYNAKDVAEIDDESDYDLDLD